MKFKYEFKNGFAISILYSYGTYSTFESGIPSSDANAAFEVAVFYSGKFYRIDTFDDVLAYVKRPELFLLAYRVSKIVVEENYIPSGCTDPFEINPYNFAAEDYEFDIVSKMMLSNEL